MPSNPTNNPVSSAGTSGASAGSASTGAGSGARTAENVKDSARNIKDQTVDKAREAGGQVKQQAQEKIEEARHQAASKLRDGKTRVAGQVGTLAHALRSAGEELRGEDQARLAEFTETAAERIERMSRYLEERSVGELLDDFERIARRSPTLFMGGAFTLGLIGARFLKTSERRRLRDGMGDYETSSASYAGAGSHTLPRPGETSGFDAGSSSYGTGMPASSMPGTGAPTPGASTTPGGSTTPGSSSGFGSSSGQGGTHG